MELKKMLEYQQADREIFKMENELNQSDAMKQAAKFKAAAQQTMDSLANLGSRARQRMDAVGRLEEKYNKAMAELAELTSECDNIADMKEAEFYDKRLDDIAAEMEALEHDMLTANDELKRITGTIESEQQHLQAYRVRFAKIKQEYAKLKQGMMEKAAPYQKICRDLRQEIDPVLLERYDRVRKNRKMPVLVPFTESGGCGGWMMELSESEKGKLAASGICECPNCGRLVYKV